MARASVGARLHFGFCNLSLSHERLYGALGVGLAEPRVVVDAEPGSGVDVTVEASTAEESPESPRPVRESASAVREDVRGYATAATDLLGVAGARVAVRESLPRHAGLGSGTRLAAATLAAVATAHGEPARVRERAPAFGRGGRSGVGVATFEEGGFVLDAGHPTARFTTDRPADGEWTVPPVAARHAVPDDWRFLLVEPDADAGRSGAVEDDAMRTAVERAEPAIADRIGGIVTRRVLPSIATGNAEAFGAAVAEIGRLNGAWYADEQGGVYRPPVGEVVASLSEASAVFGAGQSSWGPTVYGVTDAAHADAAAEAGERALGEAGVGGAVSVVRATNEGARLAEDGARADDDGARIADGNGADPRSTDSERGNTKPRGDGA
ncbi:beta-ribofuranosylaminobenzene 5'-phosphate synthase family protein [Halorubrum tebenquichense]|uniref:Beta-ribofuranosylaminobenzene 5'-phosphate synthase family protein n=1 Tax=Halorubrum tebenquichense DSM 14210 TaxID=1227485 RepID=M0DDM8_9EURY|nr:beta-ribofuranosylaminobenzene 5'-phosphate synthase family protein [Halorubrum tebenquichense]ELZ33581.1 beta-ribofuranosylaminobenzene 5'-phosphate synthase family protein [Halorubrum tebenquichense DSM 14210]